MKPLAFFSAGIACVLATAVCAFADLNPNAATGRFIRGTSDFPDVHSFVITLDGQAGIPLADTGENSDLFNGVAPWFSRTARAAETNYHLDYQYTVDQNDGYDYFFEFENPIVAFGGDVGGSPLYTNQTYRFGIHFGAQFEGTAPGDAIYAAPIRILVYQRSAFSGLTNNVRSVATNYITIPRRTVAADQSAWINFITNNTGLVFTGNGLRTEVRLVVGPTLDDAWGAQADGFNVQNAVFTLSHTAQPDSTNYYYVVEGAGVWLYDASNSEPLVYNSDFSNQGWSTLYAIGFDVRPQGRVRFLDQPQFRGEPLPPDYVGKSADEWNFYTASLTNLPSVANSTNYTGLDNSPELRRHPILDKFVSDLQNDPIALASYVVNEIGLADPIGVTDASKFPMESVNLGGINRSALGVFLEKQGSPAEQCALLVYLLRQAGYPAAYVWPTNNNLKILDTTLSKLLRMQLSGAVDAFGFTYTTNALITCNYPWVAMRLADGSTVHIFPWLKDTEVIEGLNLSGYMPTNYAHAYQWVTDYVYGKTNILGLSSDTDAPLDLFKNFVTSSLLTNYPGLSLDDFGVKFRNRRTRHSRWSDFAIPNQIDNQSQVAIVQDLTRITNVYTSWTNIFDTLRVQVQRGSTTILDTGNMRTSDLHTRKFLLYTNNNNLTLWLAPYRPDNMGQSSFTNDASLTNKQIATAALQGGDTQFNVRFIHQRHRFLNPTNGGWFYDVFEAQSSTNDRPYLKGEIASIIFNVGRSSREMVRVHAEDFWRAERQKQTNSSYAPPVEDYQGVAATVMGHSYFQRLSESASEIEQLYKVRNITLINLGLAKFAQKTVTNTAKTLPSVDMLTLPAVVAANSSLRPDLGDDYRAVFEDFIWQLTAQASALEHQTINSFFTDTNAISTVKLLQIAQKRSGGGVAGVVQLHALNYQTLGNSASAGYGGTLLKNYDPSIWQAVTNAFAEWDGDYVRVFITPAPQTNNGASYRGMAALIMSKEGGSAAIQGNLNGGWGSYEPNFAYSSGINYLDYSLGVGANDSPYFNYNSGGDSLSFNSVSTYDTANFFGGGSSLFGTPFQNDASYQIGQQYGFTSPTFANTYFAADDSGYVGNPSWLSSAGSILGDPVNPLTGEFYVDAVDLTLPGPFPLQVRRNYLSENLADNQFGVGWKWALTPYLVLTNSTQGATNTLIYATEMDGAVMAYRKQAGNDTWKPQVSDNPSLNNNNTYGIGSTANPLNARLERVITNSTDIYTLFGADGSQRRYERQAYSIVSGGTTLDRTRPYLTEWRDNRGNKLTFLYGQDSLRVDYGQVVRVESDNGNYFGFVYDSYGRIVEAYAGDGRRLFYEYDLYGDLVTVTLPDATEISYEYGRYNYTNASVVYRDSNHLITRELKPDGRQLVNQYDSLRRVTNQLATVGVDLSPIRNATFIYSNNYNPTNLVPLAGNTSILDVFNRTNRYDYTNGLITKITDPLAQTVEQQWYTDSATAPGYPRSLQRRKDRRGLWAEFKYDERGNITNMLQYTTVGMDNLTGDTANDASTTNAVSTALYTTNNLLQETTDPVGNGTRYTYDATFPWLPATVTKLASGTPVDTNLYFYHSVTNSVTNGTLAIIKKTFGLLQREMRGGAATNEWQHDGRGFITQETRFARTAEDSSNTDPPVVTTLFYDDRGELVEKTDALGRSALFDYDGMGRPKQTEVYDEYGDALSRTYNYYNPNGELVWSDGPQYNPEDYIWRDYDGAGRKITEIVWRSEVLPDSSDIAAAWGDDLFATTLYEYDALGNLTRTINPRGAVTTNSWDVLNRLVQTKVLETSGAVLTTKSFGYEPDWLVRYQTNTLGAVSETRYTATGLPRFRQNTDGSTQSWTYYKDGRLKCEFVLNGSFWTNIYQDTQRKLTRIFKQADGTPLATNIVEFDTRGNIVKTTDVEGNEWTSAYDGLNRLKKAAGPAIVTVSENCQTPGCGVYVTNVSQRITTYVYDASGKTNISINSLGEKTIRRFDTLGRLERMDITGTNGVSVRNREFIYYLDNHYVEHYEGTGATETFGVSYFDHAGRNVIDIQYPDFSGAFTRVLRRHDMVGNLIGQEEDGEWDTGAGFSGVQRLATNGWTYDGLNRVITQTARDGATTTNQYNAIGSITNKLLPGGLRRVAAFTTDGRITQEYVIGSGSERMNERSYTYYSAGSSHPGKLQTITDTRGVVQTNGYDEWCRLKTVGTSGSQAEYNTTTTYEYDRRSLMTQVSRSYVNGSIGPSTTVGRSYNGYGDLSAESVTVGASAYAASPTWDLAGRRSTLNVSPLGTFSFSYRPDGAMASVGAPGYGANYTYGDDGLLYSRSDGTKSVTYTRDDMGRLTGSVIKFGSITNLKETLTWRADTRLINYIAQRNTFTDTRSYSYAPWSRYLTNEQYDLSAGVADTQDYQYDGGVARGLGVLTGAADWDAATNGLDTLKRPFKGTTTYARVPASGKAFGAGSVSATLNGALVPVEFSKGDTNGWFYAQLVPQSGTNTFTVTAIHPSGLFTNSATSIFTNNATSHSVTNVYDAFGNVTRRVWRKNSGGLVRQQDFTWNAFNQLVKVSERDANNSGFDWTGAFDGLGRRVRITELNVISNTPSGSISTTESYFDPAVEFLEIGVSYNGKKSLKVYGPDVSGGYGGAQGIGGLEAVVDVSANTKHTVLNDRFGNVLGYAPVLQPSSFQWNAARFHSCGPKVGYETPFLASAFSLVQTVGWQGQRRDLTGLYYWNARPYDSVERRYLTLDTMGVESTPGLYPYCSGDTVNFYDADGRIVSRTWDYVYNGGVAGQGLRAISGGLDYLSEQTDSPWLAGYAGYGSSIYGSLAGMATPATYVNGLAGFGNNVSTIYNDGGFLPAASYAISGWNVGQVASGAENINLVTGGPVGDSYQRWTAISSGVASTAGIAAGGLGLYNWATAAPASVPPVIPVEQGQPLFRAVTQPELNSIQNSGQFSTVPGSSTPLPGVQGKWFYSSMEDAQAWARMAAARDGGPLQIVTTTVPKSSPPAFSQPWVDGIQNPALFYEIGNLNAPIKVVSGTIGGPP